MAADGFLTAAATYLGAAVVTIATLAGVLDEWLAHERLAPIRVGFQFLKVWVMYGSTTHP